MAGKYISMETAIVKFGKAKAAAFGPRKGSNPPRNLYNVRDPDFLSPPDADTGPFLEEGA